MHSEQTHKGRAGSNLEDLPHTLASLSRALDVALRSNLLSASKPFLSSLSACRFSSKIELRTCRWTGRWLRRPRS